MTARVGVAAIGCGVAIVAAHIVAVPRFVAATARPELAVTWSAPVVADAVPTGQLAPGVAATVEHDGAAPGLVISRWRARYRGGVTRTVAAATLVGPFQDPAAPPCSGRLAVGQALLDDGAGGAGTVAAVVRRELGAALATVDVFGIGKFKRLDALELRWVGLRDHPFDRAMFPDAALRAPAPTGYLRATAKVQFERLAVDVVLGAIPRTDGGQLGFTIGLSAAVDVDNRALAWLASRIGIDRLATRLARSQLDTALLAALGPPPPLPLPGGGELAIEVCDRPVEVVADRFAAVALRWRLTAPVVASDGHPILPPAHGPVAWPPPRPGAAITLDLDLDGVNGVLYQLWRTGLLDRTLDTLDLAGRFNTHPVVATYLTLRLSPVRLALPPVVAASAGGRLRLDVVTALAIADRASVTAATALASTTIGFAAGDRIAADVALAGLELTCRPAPDRLVPCYGDIVDAVRAGSDDVPATLGAALSTTLTELFVGQRLTAAAAPAALAITGARATTVADAGALRFELTAQIDPTP